MSEYNRKIQKRSVVTRDKIIQSAKELFVQHGYAGTSVGDIAKSAKVNQSLIHHHFGSKQDLWNIVRDEIYQGYVNATEQFLAVEQPEKMEDQLSDIIGMRFDFIKQHPDLARIMAWQSLSEMPALTSPRALDAMKEIFKRFKDAQEAGKLSKHIDTTMMGIIVLITTAGWFQNDYTWIFGDNLPKEAHEKLDKKYLDTLEQLLFKGVF